MIRTGLAVVAVVAILVSPPAPARAVAVPDSAQLSGLRAATAKAPVLLVRGDFGLVEVRRALLDSTGVRSASWESAASARPALVSTPDAQPAARPPLQWSEIARIETQHQQKTMYTLFGAVTGIAAGMLIYGTSDPSDLLLAPATGELSSAEAWALSAPVLGATAGFLIGSFTGTRTVYPPKPSQENP